MKNELRQAFFRGFEKTAQLDELQSAADEAVDYGESVFNDLNIGELDSQTFSGLGSIPGAVQSEAVDLLGMLDPSLAREFKTNKTHDEVVEEQIKRWPGTTNKVESDKYTGVNDAVDAWRHAETSKRLEDKHGVIPTVIGTTGAELADIYTGMTTDKRPGVLGNSAMDLFNNIKSIMSDESTKNLLQENELQQDPFSSSVNFMSSLVSGEPSDPTTGDSIVEWRKNQEEKKKQQLRDEYAEDHPVAAAVAQGINNIF